MLQVVSTCRKAKRPRIATLQPTSTCIEPMLKLSPVFEPSKLAASNLPCENDNPTAKLLKMEHKTKKSNNNQSSNDIKYSGCKPFCPCADYSSDIKKHRNKKSENNDKVNASAVVHIPLPPTPLRDTNAMELKYDKVYIWDLDETLVLFNSLFDGQYANKTNKDIAAGVALGESMMCFVFNLLEKYFFFPTLESENICHYDQIQKFNDQNLKVQNYNFDQDSVHNEAVGSMDRLRKIAYRYYYVRHIYQRTISVPFLTTNSSEQVFQDELLQSIEIFTDHWLKFAKTSLKAISAQNNLNILVTNTQLVPALCKLLIYQLDDYFPIDQVYSSTHIRKKTCFEMIQSKYGHDCEYIGIGDGPEEKMACQTLKMEFIKIDGMKDLKTLSERLVQELSVKCESVV